MTKGKLSNFDWADALKLETLLTEDERAIRDAAHAYAQDKLQPRVLTAYREERFARLNSLPPSAVSSPAISRDTPDCVVPSRSAARAKCSSSARISKQRSWRSSMCLL